MQRNEASAEDRSDNRLQGWKQSLIIRYALFFCLALLIYLSIADRLVPQTYDIQPNMASGKTIVAPYPFENSIETQKAKDEAARKVASVYRIVPLKNQQLIETIFDKIGTVNADAEMTFEQRLSYYRNIFPLTYSDFKNQLAYSMSQTDSALSQEMAKQLDLQEYKVPEEVYYKLPRLKQEDLAAMKPVALEITAKLMNDQVADAASARTKVTELVNSSILAKSTNREMVQEIVRFAVTPNKFYDEKATEEARGQAKDNTKPVLIKKNDVLVQKGQTVTEEIYQLLSKENLLKSQANYWPQLGVLLLVGLMTVALFLFIRQSSQSIAVNNVSLVMLVLIFVLNAAGMRIVALGQNLEYSSIGFLAPAGMGTVLLIILLEDRLALVSSIIFSVMTSIIFNTSPGQLFDFRYGFVTLAVCCAAYFSMQRASHRSSVLKAGIMMALFGAVAVAAIICLDNHYTPRDILLAISFAVAGGLLTAVLVMGIMPFFEMAFGILSPLKLVELSNPNHPLLRKLLTETPGTYHHSVMVGNLSEAAAESIGADGLLCRVGSYYHDIGKTKRPSYFIENQMNMENPHDKIDPALSKAIITAHPRDGVEMLREHKLPKPIRDIAEQHHGTTLLKFFYHKAKQLEGETPEKPITEEDYRYPGPKAQSKEAAIVGIADCVEAAVRSLRQPTVEQIDTMVRKIIKDRLDDGQFNECDLTIRELETAGQALKETLIGIFHSRIEYPSDLPPKKDGKEGE
jgi:putative nucleotidyltransferase with HDIG domain